METAHCKGFQASRQRSKCARAELVDACVKTILALVALLAPLASGCVTGLSQCVLADALQRVILDLHALPDDARKMAPAVASRNPSTGFAAAGRNTSQAED